MKTLDEKMAEFRADRAIAIDSIAWRYERHYREVRMGIPTTDNIAVLDAYVQTWADAPTTAGFPDTFVAPTKP